MTGPGGELDSPAAKAEVQALLWSCGPLMRDGLIVPLIDGIIVPTFGESRQSHPFPHQTLLPTNQRLMVVHILIKLARAPEI